MIVGAWAMHFGRCDLRLLPGLRTCMTSVSADCRCRFGGLTGAAAASVASAPLRLGNADPAEALAGGQLLGVAAWTSSAADPRSKGFCCVSADSYSEPRSACWLSPEMELVASESDDAAATAVEGTAGPTVALSYREQSGRPSIIQCI